MSQYESQSYRKTKICRSQASKEDGLNDQRYSASDPRHHSQQTCHRFDVFMSHMRYNVPIVDDPQTKALLKAAAELIQGLVKIFKRFEESSADA